MLTDPKIKSLKPRAKPYRVADGRGLCLQVNPTGNRFWRYRYRFNGAAQMFTLGEYPDVGLQTARRMRDEARAQVKQGIHPTRAKHAEKLRKTKEGANTFELVTRQWFGLQQDKLNKKYHAQNLRRMEQLIFPHMGKLPVTEITTPVVVDAIERIGARGTIETANRMKQVIGQIFRYSIQKGLCVMNPAADLRGILPFKAGKHHPCIPLAELPDLLQAIEKREEDFSKIAMELLSLTFVRTGELIGARWEEINWDRGEWLIPANRMKAKRPHIVPLSRQTIRVLERLRKLTGEREFLFFSAASKSKHMSNGTVLMALRRMGYQGRMSGHGFRSLASTLLNEKGFSSDDIELQLAHVENNKVRAAYNHAERLLERKAMMQKYADMLDTIRAGKGADILPLQRLGHRVAERA